MMLISTAALAASLSSSSSINIPTLRRGAASVRTVQQRCGCVRLSQDPDPGDETEEESTGADPWDSSLSVLSRRLTEVRDGERDEKIRSLSAAAANWNAGRCAQRTLVILDEWVRRLHTMDGVLACGTYSGEVVLVDIATGEVLETWQAVDDQPLGDDGPMADLDDDDDDLPEITAIEIAEDADHVLAGDAAGAVVLRRRGRAEPLVDARHGDAVTGVHSDLVAGRLYSASLDAKLCCHDSATGALLGSLVTRAPILSMSVCDNYCALGLGDGTVSICTLSPMRQVRAHKHVRAWRVLAIADRDSASLAHRTLPLACFVQILAFDAHREAASAVHLLSGSSLLSGCADGSVCLWRLDEEGDSERRCTRFEGHSGPVVCLQGDVEKVVSGARDGTVRVWEASTGKMRFVLQGFTAYLGSLQMGPTCVCLSRSSDRLVPFAHAEVALD